MRDIFLRLETILPILVTILTTVVFAFFVWHFWRRRQSEYEEEVTIEAHAFEMRKEPEFDESVKSLMTRDDVTLRVLEEIYAARRFSSMESRRASLVGTNSTLATHRA